jgi:hypothetical protein
MSSTAVTAPGALHVSAARAVGLALVAVGVASLHLPGRPPTLCLLRATTGVPCPLCGGTTATVDLGQGQLVRAFLASPLVVLGVLALIVRPLVADQLARLVLRKALWPLIASGAALSELWQLHRFALL